MIKEFKAKIEAAGYVVDEVIALHKDDILGMYFGLQNNKQEIGAILSEGQFKVLRHKATGEWTAMGFSNRQDNGIYCSEPNGKQALLWLVEMHGTSEAQAGSLTKYSIPDPTVSPCKSLDEINAGM